MIALWQREPKTLDYEIVNNVAILTSHANLLREKLKVTYEREPLDDPHIVTIRIVNTGKRAVVKGDYDQPIEIDYENRGPFDGSVIAAKPPGIFAPESIYDEFDANKLGPSLRPDLLNPGDEFVVQLLSEGEPGEVMVSCRFADQTRPMRRLGHDAFAGEVLKTVALEATLTPAGRIGIGIGRRR